VPLCFVHMLRIDISSWWIVPFINMKLTSLSLLIDFPEVYFVGYEYGYSCLFIGSICLENFFPSFDSKPVFIFSVKWVSCKQHMVGSYFLTQFALLWLLIEALRPFTFSVNIERCLFPVMSWFLTYFFCYSCLLLIIKMVIMENNPNISVLNIY
jgi:hypothetical protein